LYTCTLFTRDFQNFIIIIFFNSINMFLINENLKLHMWTMYKCIAHVLHLVNSASPSSLSVHTCCSDFQFWIHCGEFSENSLQNEWNVSWIGLIFHCSVSSEATIFCWFSWLIQLLFWTTVRIWIANLS
jgi:hypothetical protein